MLKQDTENVWNSLQSQRDFLKGFVLVGGTALALQIHHRISEDLDFAYTGEKLPRTALQLLTRQGLTFVADDDPVAVREAEDCLMDLGDYSQTYLVNGSVKVTFFVPDAAERHVLSSHHQQVLAVATLQEIFALKSLVVAKRSKSRDFFDLYVLMKDHGYSFADFYQVFQQTKTELAYDLAAARLCSGLPGASDEGWVSLLENPPTPTEMSAFFQQQKNEYEQAVAEKALEQETPPPNIG